MPSIKTGSDSFDDLTDGQIEELIKSNDDLDIEQKRMLEQQIEDEAIKALERRSKNNPYRRIRKSPLEIVNRSLFFLFLSSFLFSFYSVYALNKLWFILYIISAFSCILYTPNRKALKELLAAWPNIVDILRGNSK